ncbi:MAG TPA: MATE family efflux transporter [Clostridia bacterium]|nr:MAG: Multidrug export protein MepA [Firmicutes bacterium ADurb.Bin248]HOS18279.1 MATE family efflux transporter [Clostridia bacterium]HPK14527.1 MATE family efflux transporter [Clostridia bacterium]
MARNYEMDMTQGPLLSKIVRFSLPVVLMGLLQFLYSAADMIVAGKFAGSEALAAVGSTGSLINLIVALFLGISVGVSVAVAQHFGAREYDAVGKTVHTAILVALVGGAALGAFGFFMSRAFLVWMGSPADVIDQAALYMRIYFIGLPMLMLYNFGASVLRAVGDTKRPLYFLIIASVVHIALNLLLVIRFHMGVAGVALATVVSQALSAALVVNCLMRTPGPCRLELKKLALDWGKLGEMMHIGLPAGVQSSLFSVSNVLIQSSINSFGSIAMAGNSAAANLENFIYISMNSVSQSALTFVSQNVGARRYERIGASVRYCNALVFAVGALTGAVLILLRTGLLSLYNADPEVISYGSVRLLIIAPTYFICGFMEVYTGGLRGMGRSVTPMLVSIFGACVLRILWLATVFRIFQTTASIYISYPVSWLITMLVQMLCFNAVKKKITRQPQERGQEEAAIGR